MLGFRGSGFGVLGFWLWGGVGSAGIVPEWWYGSAVSRGRTHVPVLDVGNNAV